MEKEILAELISIYKVPKAKICSDHDDNRRVTLQIDGLQVSGFPSSALSLHEAASKRNEKLQQIDSVLLYHWLSFCTAELFHCSNAQDLQQSLDYLNNELVNRPYLCGFKESIGDVVVFKVLKPFVIDWSYQMKEEYINVSRWFSNMLNSVSGGEAPDNITFSRTLLYTHVSPNSLKV